MAMNDTTTHQWLPGRAIHLLSTIYLSILIWAQIHDTEVVNSSSKAILWCNNNGVKKGIHKVAGNFAGGGCTAVWECSLAVGVIRHDSSSQSKATNLKTAYWTSQAKGANHRDRHQLERLKTRTPSTRAGTKENERGRPKMTFAHGFTSIQLLVRWAAVV